MPELPKQRTPDELGAALVRYDAMCAAIDAAYNVDEVKDIRDKALAIEVYTRQAKNTEAERRACDIRLRAERRAGALLREMEKAKAGRPPENRSADTTDFRGVKTLADLGISKDQSSKWQQLAAVPDEQFEAALAGPEKPTTSGIIEATKPVPPISTEPVGDLRLDHSLPGARAQPIDAAIRHVLSALKVEGRRRRSDASPKRVLDLAVALEKLLGEAGWLSTAQEFSPTAPGSEAGAVARHNN